ncbi:MAG TPA: lytic murein transglycosylase, partial [Sphingomicrobium sp.]|nr:lytic murein transglycosylase [Sphingomicrobium sp.]
ATPPLPMPPIPMNASWLLAEPEPMLVSTGDAQVDEYRRKLIEEGDPVWRPIFRRLLADVRADPSIIQRYDAMRAIDTPTEYLRFYLTPQRIADGRALYDSLEGADLPEDGTPLELKLALWGMLSNYSKRPDFDLLSAMVTLAAHGKLHQMTAFPIHDAAMLIVDRTVDRARLRGYDSGRMGDVQMTPDFYSRLRRDGDGDGFADIWDNRADIFANLWIDMTGTDGPLIIPVKPHDFDSADPGQSRLIQEMTTQSVMATYFERWDGKPWTRTTGGWSGRYVEPFGKQGPAFLLPMAATPLNFRDPYMEGYSERGDGFAIAAALLAEAIAGRPTPDMDLMTR